MAAPSRKKRLGQPLDWSAETTLDQLAEVREPDVADAVAFWREHAPPALRGLLDAEVVEPDAD